MISGHASDLATMIGESERQRAEVAQILASLSTGQAHWRPSEQKWSVLGHVAHMCLVNESYTQAIDACIAKARERGRLSKGPYKHGWFGRWFTRSMEPPPKRRWVTGKAMVPDPRTGRLRGRFPLRVCSRRIGSADGGCAWSRPGKSTLLFTVCEGPSPVARHGFFGVARAQPPPHLADPRSAGGRPLSGGGGGCVTG